MNNGVMQLSVGSNRQMQHIGLRSPPLLGYQLWFAASHGQRLSAICTLMLHRVRLVEIQSSHAPLPAAVTGEV